MNDHGMDALRYMVMRLDGVSSYGVEVATRGLPAPVSREPQESGDAYMDLVSERNRRWDMGR